MFFHYLYTYYLFKSCKFYPKYPIIVDKNTLNSANNTKYVVWALYDDSESSYKKGIKKYFDGLFSVHSIGINNIVFPENNNYFYHKIDLSLSNFNLFNQLKELPRPDIILASPPCESWSGADCGGKMFRSINDKGEWIVMNRSYYSSYNNNCHPVKKRYFEQKEMGRILGESTIGATIRIIETYKPKVWVIENPQTSKTWDFQKHHWSFNGEMNLTYYSSYDNSFSPKPTIFKSNKKFNLISKKEKGNNLHMAKGNYSKRSSIPLDLIKDLVQQIIHFIDSGDTNGK